MHNSVKKAGSEGFLETSLLFLSNMKCETRVFTVLFFAFLSGTSVLAAAIMPFVFYS